MSAAVTEEALWLAESCILQARYLGLVGMEVDVMRSANSAASLVARFPQADVEAAILWRGNGCGKKTDPIPPLAAAIIARAV